MRDGKLYKELGYQNFEDYCETEVGIKRRQVYNYISIVEKLPEDFVQPVAQIGMSKLYLLSTLSEGEREEVMQTTDVEKVSKRELEADFAAGVPLHYNLAHRHTRMRYNRHASA